MASVKYFAASVTADGKFKIKIAFMRGETEHTVTYVYQKDKVMMIYLDNDTDIQFRFHDNTNVMMPFQLLLGSNIMLERMNGEVSNYLFYPRSPIDSDYARDAIRILEGKMIDATLPEGWAKQIRDALCKVGKLDEEGFPFCGPEEGVPGDPCVWFGECDTGLLIELTTEEGLKGLYLP